MTSRTLKLLTASSAFIAATSAVHAVDVISTPQTTTAFISETTAGTLTINAAINISGSLSPAVAISGTSGTGAVVINNNSNISSPFGTSTVYLAADSSVTRVTINNSGTIVSANNHSAMQLSHQNADGNDIDITIHNHGTISGNIQTGDGDVIYSGHNATQNGDITTGNGTNIVILNNSRYNGDYTGGTGNDTFTLTNSTVSGTIAGGTGTNEINIDGNRTFTLQKGSLITGFQTVNVDTNVVLNDGITGASDLNVAAAKTLTVNNGFNMANGGIIFNDGTVNIAGGKIVQTDDYQAGAGSTLGIGVDGPTTGSLLRFRTGSGNGLDATSATIHIGDKSGYIVSGTRINVVDGDGASVNPTLLKTETGVYRYRTEVTGGGNNVDLVIGRISTSDAVKGDIGKNVADVLDTLGTGVTNELVRVQSAIGQAQNAQEVQKVVDSLTPSIEGTGATSINVTVNTGNQISNRLASIRTGYGSGTGVATGDPLATSHMWVEGIGSTVKQDDKGGRYGYDANSAGASMGLDTDTIIDGVTTGIAATYAKSTVDSNSTSGATSDINTYAATLYGSRVFDAGLFFNGQLGFGYNQYDMSRNVVSLGKAEGSTDGYQATAKLEAGQDFAAGGFTLTPLASVQYTYLDIEKYTETGVGNAGLTVTPDAMSTIDAGLGLKLAYAMALADGGTFVPSVHAKYIKRFGDRELATTSSFIGASGVGFNTTGVEGDDSSINLGGGLLLTTVGGTDLSLNYDADIRDSLTGHTGQVKARWAF